jgi:hypothetical protein
MGSISEDIEEQLVIAFKLGMMDAFGGRNKPNPIPALKECVDNVKNLVISAGGKL